MAAARSAGVKHFLYASSLLVYEGRETVNDPEADIKATIHSNRKLPLLNEFPLKPGRITMARFSKGHDRATMVLGGGEMVRAVTTFFLEDGETRA